MADIKKLVPKADMINVDSSVSPITYTPEQTAYTYDPTVPKEPVKEAAARVQYLASPGSQYAVQPVQPQQTYPVYKPVIVGKPKGTSPANNPSTLDALKTVSTVRNIAKGLSKKSSETPATVNPDILKTNDTVKDVHKKISEKPKGYIQGYFNDKHSLTNMGVNDAVRLVTSPYNVGKIIMDSDSIGDGIINAYKYMEKENPILGNLAYISDKFGIVPDAVRPYVDNILKNNEPLKEKSGWWNDRTENPSHLGYDAVDVGSFWIPYAGGARIAGGVAKAAKLGKIGTTVSKVSGGLAADTGFGSIKEATKKFYEDN